MTAEEKAKLEAEKAAQAQPAATQADVVKPTGAGRFKDVVTVKGTKAHPTMPNKEYKVHSAHVPYLTNKGYIQKV